MLRMPSTRKAAVSQRNVAIHELVCRRDRSLVSIGKQFGLTPQRVHQISKKMDSLLYKELAETVHLIKARQTATLRHVVDEAMAAWRDSKGLDVGHTTTVNSGGSLSLSGGTLSTPALILNGGSLLNAAGDVPANISGMTNSTIVATGTLSIGDVNSSGGFDHQGSLLVGNHHVALYSKDVSRLGSLTTIGNGRLWSFRPISVNEGGSLSLSGGMLDTPDLRLNAHASLNATGDVPANISGMTSSNIMATGTLSIGDSNSYGGFDHQGSLSVGNHEVTLTTKGFAKLGSLTTIDDGTLQAANGVYLRGGSVLTGSGTVDAKLAAGFGSTIEATGDLDLGSSSSVSGFFSDGELIINTQTVTIHDQNIAVLGSFTDLGSDSDGGTLAAPNGLLIEQGKDLAGRGVVTGDLVNHGNVYGDSSDAAGQLIFDAGHIVSGNGAFSNVLFNGTYSPGNSPGIVHLADTAFGSDATVEIEIGGLNAGSDHDSIVFEGTSVSLDGQLNIELTDGFVPSESDSFQVFDFTGLASGGNADGTFSAVLLPDLPDMLGWDSSDLYSSGTLSVIPEPTTLPLLALGLLLAKLWRPS